MIFQFHVSFRGSNIFFRPPEANPSRTIHTQDILAKQPIDQLTQIRLNLPNNKQISESLCDSTQHHPKKNISIQKKHSDHAKLCFFRGHIFLLDGDMFF